MGVDRCKLNLFFQECHFLHRLFNTFFLILAKKELDFFLCYHCQNVFLSSPVLLEIIDLFSGKELHLNRNAN